MAVGGQGSTGEGRWKHGNNPHQWSGKGKRDLGPRRFMLCPEDKSKGSGPRQQSSKEVSMAAISVLSSQGQAQIWEERELEAWYRNIEVNALKNLASSDSPEEVAHSSPLKSRMSYFLKTRWGFCLARHTLFSGSLYSLPSWPRYSITRCEKGENGQYGEHCLENVQTAISYSVSRPQNTNLAESWFTWGILLWSRQ